MIQHRNLRCIRHVGDGRVQTLFVDGELLLSHNVVQGWPLPNSPPTLVSCMPRLVAVSTPQHLLSQGWCCCWTRKTMRSFQIPCSSNCGCCCCSGCCSSSSFSFDFLSFSSSFVEAVVVVSLLCSCVCGFALSSSFYLAFSLLLSSHCIDVIAGVVHAVARSDDGR